MNESTSPEETASTPVYEAFAQAEVTLSGTRMHYVDVGRGPPVVLVHGSPLSSFAFRHQIVALAPRFRVIAPDLPGFGQSEALREGPLFPRQSDALRALFDYLDLDEFRLLGHDWGGPIGVGAVTDRLERVRQLVLLNTTLRSDFRPPPYWKPFTAAHVGDVLLVNLKLFSRGLPLLLRAARSRPVREHYAQFLSDKGTCQTILSLERLEGFDALMGCAEPAVRGLTVPVLILWGHPDPYFGRDELSHLKAMFPDVTVREIEGGGHFAQEDAPETVTRELLAFLR